jgi:D-threonate/D-erythronate kinase
VETRAPLRAVRLMADDLTGALDTAAQFVPAFGTIRTGWSLAGAGEGTFALDTGTRERNEAEAAAHVAALAPFLAPLPGVLAFFKVDSLLRGHAGAELAALLAVQSFRHILIAPAIPFQGRVTRGGRQHVRDAGGWIATGEDLAAHLATAGHKVAHRLPGDAVPEGISLWDCETAHDLARLAAAGLALEGPVLFVGAAGLAAALASALTPAPGGVMAKPALYAPLLGLIGSDHPAMRGQLARVGEHIFRLSSGDDAAAGRITQRLAETGVALVTADLPDGIDREAARARIDALFADLAPRLPRPGLLFVSGGETLHTLAGRLGIESLAISGEFQPGAPVSTLVGGRWDGLAIVSKSGAFGAADFLEILIGSLESDRKARP